MNFAEYMGNGVGIEPVAGRGEKEKRRNGETHRKSQVATNHTVQCQPNRSDMSMYTPRIRESAA